MIKFKFAAIAGLMGALAGACAAQTTKPDASGDLSTAARLSVSAQRAVPGENIRPAHFRLSAALLEAAMRLDPKEPRYPRLLIDALLTLRGDKPDEELTSAALSAATAYRKLAPQDRNMEIMVIDLYLSKMQSTDEQLRYLGDLLKDTRVHTEVRSAVAVRAVDLYANRKEQPQALAGLREAQRLNPLNIDAIMREYEWVHRTAAPADRLGSLLTLLKANPAQFKALLWVGDELTAAGLIDDGLVWYERAMQLAMTTGAALPREIRAKHACVLQIAGRPEAELWAEELLRTDQGDYTALVQERRKGNDKGAATLAMRARNTLVNILATVRKFDPKAATQPAAEKPLEVPDLSDDPSSLNKASTETRDTYNGVLSELAWFEIYHNKNAAEGERLLKALAGNLPENHPLLARLQGWLYLITDKKDEAKVKLSAVAANDPLAALGLLKLYADGGDDAAKANALKNASAGAFGLNGAIVSAALRDMDMRIQPGPQAAALRLQLDRFPRELLGVLDSEGAQKFYLLKVEPLKTRHLFGEPMFVKVTIQNISSHGLTIGRDGLIRPDLWFDATSPQPGMPHVCYDRIAQQGVLQPKESITQIVRVDGGDLGRLLDANPIAVITIGFRMRLNPLPVQMGDQQTVISTPGGYSVDMTRTMERTGFPMRDETSIQPLRQSMMNGEAGERIRAMDCMRALSAWYGSPPEKAEPQAKDLWRGISLRMAAEVAKGLDDNDPVVRAWARYFYASATKDDAMKVRMATQLLTEEPWQARVIGLELLRTLGPERQKQFAEKVSRADADPTVRKLAAAIVEVADLPPPTTQPATTQPATTQPTRGGYGP